MANITMNRKEKINV